MVRQLIEFRNRRDISSEWTRKNPILDDGEKGVERDTGTFKMGDGVTPWNDLLYFVPQNTVDPDGLETHIVSPTPHPAYDDLPSLTLLFENGLQ